MRKNALVLSSGGIDSTACIQYYLDRGYEVDALFLNYGQPAADMEFESVKKIANYFEIELNVINCLDLSIKYSGEILGRNALLINIGLIECKFKSGLVVIGIHSGVNYKDCSLVFINDMRRIFDIYTDGLIDIDAPFIDYTKADIIRYCESKKIPLDLTYSCERGGERSCGTCNTCIDLEGYYASKKDNN